MTYASFLVLAIFFLRDFFSRSSLGCESVDGEFGTRVYQIYFSAFSFFCLPVAVFVGCNSVTNLVTIFQFDQQVVDLFQFGRKLRPIKILNTRIQNFERVRSIS